MKTKSDGCSSSYYDLKVFSSIEGRWVEVKVGDIVRDGLNNQFDLGNIFKACRRISELRQGRGKEGTDEKYDLNKILYFSQEEVEILEEVENGMGN